MCVWGGGLVEPCPSHRHQPPSRPAAQLHLYLRQCGGVCTRPAKTGNAKDKGRGHDDEKEGEEMEEEGTSRESESEGETWRDGLMRASANKDRASVSSK